MKDLDLDTASMAQVWESFRTKVLSDVDPQSWDVIFARLCFLSGAVGAAIMVREARKLPFNEVGPRIEAVIDDVLSHNAEIMAVIVVLVQRYGVPPWMSKTGN